ncbi:hypothetical protein AB0368_38135 [Actinoplanes sp. NPDC051475]
MRMVHVVDLMTRTQAPARPTGPRVRTHLHRPGRQTHRTPRLRLAHR